MVKLWKKQTVALCAVSAVLISGCATQGGDSTSLASTDNSWSIRHASAQVDGDAVKLTVFLRDPVSRNAYSNQRRHLSIEVDRENGSETSQTTVDLNMMQRASITEFSQEDGEITGIRVAFHDDHIVEGH